MYLISFQYPGCSIVCEQIVEKKADAEDYVHDLVSIGCKVWMRSINY